jgi:malonate decarboxylase gamma subunit
MATRLPGLSSRRRWRPRVLVGLPGADPAVMDLPSMAKVTKLSLEVLEERARSTPVFAPGLPNLARTGAVHLTWDDTVPLVDQLEALLANMPDARDRRDALRQGAWRPVEGPRHRRARP